MMIPELLPFIVGLVGASGDSVVQCTNTTTEGQDGDTVILPCSKKDEMDISYEEVMWTFKDPTTGEHKNVHTYFQGKDILQIQSDDFKDRTSLFKEELSSGNCSLSLLVNTSHSGRYYSCVGGLLCCTVNLKVLPKGEEDSSQKHQEVTVSPDDLLNGTDGLTTTLSVVLCVPALLLICIAFLIYWLRKRHSSGIKPNNPQTHPSVSYHQDQQPPQNQENNPADQNQNEEQIQMLENEDQDDPADGNKPTADN